MSGGIDPSEESPKFAKQEQEPASAEILEVVPGVLRIQLPITMPGLGHVNTYAMAGSDGVVLVDPGMPDAASFRVLRKRLRDAGLAIEEVTSVVVTHSHPDHFGGVRRIMEKADVAMIADQDFGRLVLAPGIHQCGQDADDGHVEPEPLQRDIGGDSAYYVENFDRTTWVGPVWMLPRPWNGQPLPPPVSRAKRLALRYGFRPYLRYIMPPLPKRRVSDGDKVRAGGRVWHCVRTPGHTLDHLCLYDPEDGTLISGDHVLPTITPHIPGVGGGPDPLAGFLESLGKVSKIGEVALALPAHGHPFANFAQRVEEIRQHHASRLQRLRDALAAQGGMSIEEISHTLFRPQRWGPMAQSEAFAHMEHLRLGGEVTAHPQNGELVYELA